MRARTKRIAHQLTELGIDTDRSYDRNTIEKLIRSAKSGDASGGDDIDAGLPMASKLVPASSIVAAADGLDLTLREDHDDEEVDVEPDEPIVTPEAVATARPQPKTKPKQRPSKRKQTKRSVKSRRQVKTTDVKKSVE